ncbi:MAG TPA: GTPase HflX [Thermoanaerobaculia bacterium]|nr:GTPase HflX [Thermoanaerobaculia bacterium]
MTASEKPARERAITVGLALPENPPSVVEEHLDELEKLSEAAGGEVVGRIVQERRSPDAATFIGKGKVAELAELATARRANLVIFDDDLSPAQARNLEKAVGRKVIDRSGLILDIFARRARSREARTQVELAQLKYLLPRLTRQWTHLERQAGGIGTRGVGETQLELDRRIIRERISRLQEELTRIEKTRETQRRGRDRAYTVALVGYTNAGKSTLFNRLTQGETFVMDQLFATLDSKLQKAHAPMPRETVYIDTVGFIRKLPHHLVASFRSTMEEASSADLVLHVINLAHRHVEDQRQVGQQVLGELGVPEAKILEVFNKVDAVPQPSFLERSGREAVTVSALTAQGIGNLIERIRQRELGEGEVLQLEIPASEGKLAAWAHEIGIVRERVERDGVVELTAWIPHEQRHQFEPYRVAAPEAPAETA